ncbi:MULTISPECIES: MarR family transcriptional regulator [unclassified Microbacterium]|jgi:DNA-binding MarR family transcriptional regulator|uniref:MarR family winged helix-turn-helix transcriptional regulator n=1 Tax=unclassified Microbacterium TaxID=2609290 RepID=UPI0023DAD6EE|nr:MULTISPECIES: MarR family transcriptional regulator [unclassified Microbacterium]MDF2046397.1 MarR family transcriptional regulator [Microbacterium sp. Kw_RZR3]MDF2918921.1 MarR family transcriptional regulator [Microbacterium sp.]MDQ1076193.1 DNA-binding MarR family transcriptional regulator [Microbacterium sp. SORGH_AS_0969]MDQ1116430.1 DNA-binding MarR family transcriptional regulator [Microbacterium testaceum]
MDDLLSENELRLWHAWKAATDTVRTRVAEEITTVTGLSDPDYGVLSRLVDLGDGELRQNKLAASMGWHRSRLSHQLTRMEQRGLVTRADADGGVLVTITPTGREQIDKARPVHARAVRRSLSAHVPLEDFARVLMVLEALTAP